jgi:diguanylate cyclase (GGDEF)-like protein/PAS domain S-box-containing protein
VGLTIGDVSLLVVVLAAVAGLTAVNHRRERMVRRSEMRLDALLQQAHDVVVVLDGAGAVTFVSAAVQQLLGHEPAGFLGRPFVDLVHPDDRGRLDQAAGPAAPGITAAVPDVRLLDDAGGQHWVDVQVTDLGHRHAHVGVTLLTCHDVTPRRALQDQLAFRARHDPLTGLRNRAVFSAGLEELAMLDDPRPYAVLFIDLDHFKQLNDTLGHAAGDEALRRFADRLRGVVRRDDQGGGDRVYRLGGDEFAVLILDADEAEARAVADRIVTVAGEPFELDGRTTRIGATVGVAVCDPAQEDPGQALRRADQAMYQAKDAGRGSYALAHPSA